MEYIVPSWRIVALTSLDETSSKADRMLQLLELEDDRFIAGFQQQVQKARKRAWHDKHIK